MKDRLSPAVVLLCIVSGLSACQPRSVWNGSLEDLLRSQPHRFATIMADPAKHRVQIIYTQIDRGAENRPLFRSYTYRLNADEYFYPASTVKLPVSLLALEKINRLNIPKLDRDAPMLTGGSRAWPDEQERGSHRTRRASVRWPLHPQGAPDQRQ